MKKSVCAVLLCAVVTLAAVPAWAQAAREATIEPETKARIVLQSQLNSKLNEVGDTITAVLYEPVYVNGMLALPRGTEFLGRVTEVKPAGKPLKNGRMTIIFERIAMPWGQEPVSIVVTSLDDWDNNKKLKADDEGNVSGDVDGRKTAENVALGGGIGTSAGISTVLLGGGGAAGGAAIAGGLLGGLFLSKGGDVRVQPGAIFRIKFIKPLTLPVSERPAGSPRPIQQEEPKVPPPPVEREP